MDVLNQDREEITSMTTDAAGNVYAITRITKAPNCQIEGQTVSFPSGNNVSLIISYSCEGKFRWAKITQFRNGMKIYADAIDGIYIGGNINSNEFFLGNLNNYNSDTSMTFFSSGLKNICMVKLDTAGNMNGYQHHSQTQLALNLPKQPVAIFM